MNLWESIRIALDGLSANKMRSGLTMLGVIIGVAAVIAMIAIAQGAREQTMQRIQALGTNVLIVMPGQMRRGAVMGGAGSNQTMTLEDAAAIPPACPSVTKVAPESRSNAQVKYKNMNTSTTVFGTTPDYLTVRDYKVEQGRFFTDREVKSAARVATIGQTTLTNLFGQSSALNKYVRIRGISFRIVGVMAAKGAGGGWNDPDDQIFIPISTAMRRVFGVNFIRGISAQAVSMSKMAVAQNEIETILRKRHKIGAASDPDFTIRNQAEFMETAEETSRTFTLLLAGIASVSLLVGGIGIMNIMLVSVTERTREIGLRKAIGARRRDILLQFLIEAVVLSLVGGTVGILLGVGGSAIVGTASGWNVVVSPQSIVVAFLFAAGIGVFFGIYPARRAAALDPIDALRYE